MEIYIEPPHSSHCDTMEDQVSIDKLEDQLIDHPDKDTKQESEISLDETFQRKLNERAQELNQQPNIGIQIRSQSEINYTFKDHELLPKELSEWFTFNDYKILGGLSNLAIEYEETLLAAPSEEALLTQCISNLDSVSLDCLIYYIFGKYKDCDTEQQQVDNIKNNCETLLALGLFKPIITMLSQFMTQQLETKLTPQESTDYFKGLTIFYFCINYAIIHESLYYKEMRQFLNDTDIISKIIDIVEYWKLEPDSSLKIRYLILILWKLLLLEFGTTALLNSCDEFLLQHHNIENNKTKSPKITCSPLDYYTFREDLLDKYPLFNESSNFDNTIDTLDLDNFRLSDSDPYPNSSSRNNSINSDRMVRDEYNRFMALNTQNNSLSKYIGNPRPNKIHTVQSQLPSATVHIATPVPSPPSTASDFMAGGEKIRKLYQVNQGMPFIYPTNEIEVPYSIREANDILVSSIYDSYSNQRMWNERQKFMIQERGYINEYEVKANDEFEYDESLITTYPLKENEIRSILRVEKFYSVNLNKLNNLILVLLETIRSCKYDKNLEFIEKQLNGNDKRFENDKTRDDDKWLRINQTLIHQLEVMNVKEITMKACSAIIILLIRWFKISHILKSHYVTSLLVDREISQIVVDFLNNSFNNLNSRGGKENEFDYLYQNKLMNPPVNLPELNFFNNCLNKSIKPEKYELINKMKISDFPYTVENGVHRVQINKFNSNYCFTLVNLLNILNKSLTNFHRIYSLNELRPSELLKLLVVNYDCAPISTPVLKILKKLVPYQGRKWKSNNMDLISLIYLSCNLSMRDNWLSGRDLENDFNNAIDQEISLRGLLQFYHMRKYPNKMVHLGYEIPKDFVPLPIDDHFDYV